GLDHRRQSCRQARSPAAGRRRRMTLVFAGFRSGLPGFLGAALCAAWLALGPPTPAIAAPGSQLAALSPDDVATVARVERYLNGIQTLQGRFVQMASNGAYAEGEIYLERPGHLRFDYDPPSPVLIIANGL